jgi:hypothetical protein
MKHTGPGRSEKLVNPARFMLYNFDIDGAQLKVEHQMALRSTVVPTLRSGGSVSIVGLASRSGKFTHNDRLSLHRAESVRAFLERSVQSRFSVREFKWFGERKAKLDHQRDGSENERYRCVLLFLSSGPVAPLPQINGASLQEIPIPKLGSTEGVLDTAGKILDVASGVGSVLSLALDAVIIDIAGTAIGALATLLGMPAVWLESNKFAQQNGQKLGFSKAMQEMADAFADDDLRFKPEANWPSVPHPVPKFPGRDEAVTLAERSARAGQREGYEAAWSLIMRMEKTPRTIPVSLKGKTLQIQLSGRRFLWLIHRAYQEDVWRQILRRLG